MRSQIKMDELEAEQNRWLKALDDGGDDKICRLASSFRRGDRCTIFQPHKQGSFNVCFFVEFNSPRERWVVRLPMPGAVPKAIMDEKTEVEVATMRYVSAKTKIPIPKVHAYAFSNTGLNGLPFIIMDYVEGRNLKDLGFKANDTWGLLLEPQTPAAKHLHQQLADVYLQLRQLEFPQIGALGLPSRDTPALTCSIEDISVCNRPLTIEMTLQELDGLEPSFVFPPKTTFSTARDYVDGLLELANNKLEKEKDQGMDEAEPASIIYAAHHFKQFVQNGWLNKSANKGPFVLVHGDMDSVISNLLFDNDHNLVAIVDWEWSRVVPAQLMVPPIWLSATQMDSVMLSPRIYNDQVCQFRAVVQEREKALGLPPVLSTEWEALQTWPHTVLVTALNNPSFVYDVYWDLIFIKKVPKNPTGTREQAIERHEKEVVPRIRAFMNSSKKSQALLEKKIREQREFFEAEKVHYGHKNPIRMTKSCFP